MIAIADYIFYRFYRLLKSAKSLTPVFKAATMLSLLLTFNVISLMLWLLSYPVFSTAQYSFLIISILTVFLSLNFSIAYYKKRYAIISKRYHTESNKTIIWGNTAIIIYALASIYVLFLSLR